jgi:hypothetical protein
MARARWLAEAKKARAIVVIRQKGSTRGRTEQKGPAAPHWLWELCCAMVGVGGGGGYREPAEEGWAPGLYADAVGGRRAEAAVWGDKKMHI